MSVVFSPAANDDLMEIAVFIAQDNPKRALSFVDELEDKCQVLGVSPGIGTRRPELGEGVLMLPHGRYVIFYREAEQGIRIERILHSSRDIDDGDIAESEPTPSD